MARVQNLKRESEAQPKGLVVDDDPVWLGNFARYLADAGLVVTKASSRLEAESLLDRQFFYVALVDLSLVGDDNRDGLLILQKIYNELREGTAGILLTAYGTPEEGAEAKTVGVFHVFNKRTLDYETVLHTIQRAIAHSLEQLQRYRVGLNLLAGPGIPEDKLLHETSIIMALQHGAAEVDALVTELVKGLYPVLRLKTAARAVIDSEHRLVSGIYWSKMRAAPFSLLLGGASVIEAERNKFNDRPQEYADGAYQRIVKFERYRDFAGIVFERTSPGFDAFDPRHDPFFQEASKRATHR